MNYKYKTFFFKFLEFLPNSVGDFLYHQLQNFTDKMSIEKRLQNTDASYQLLQEKCKKLQIDFDGKSVLEIGSGWLPMLPYFFKYLGKAKKIYTYDINPHFQKKLIQKLNVGFAKIYGYEVVEVNAKYGLPDGIDYFPSKNVINEDLPNADYIFTRYVLSHMKKNEVIVLHEKLKKTMPKGTIIIHFISPSDLRQYGNSAISMQDFLKFSESEWDKIRTRFDYHNRLRLPEFIAIFKAVGLELMDLSYAKFSADSKNYKLFKELILHEDYKKYSDEELTAGNILVILKT
jgi:hypothetical protein